LISLSAKIKLMKKIILFSFTTLLLLNIFTKTSFSAGETCESLRIDPVPQQTNTFTATAFGCNFGPPEENPRDVVVRIYAPQNHILNFPIVINNGGGSVQITPINIPAGTYDVHLLVDPIVNLNPAATATVTVTQPQSAATCGQEISYELGYQCPFQCPRTRNLQDGKYYCQRANDSIALCSRGAQTETLVGVETALGCIRFTDIISLAQDIMARAVAFAGGISILLIIAGAFQIITSQGDPEKIISGREYITAAIGGLVMVIFAIFVLRLIGVDILGVIPR
jgi:hypothetical protein